MKKNNIDNGKIKISYEQVIAGALTKMDKVDDIDVSLIVEDLKKDNDIDFLFFSINPISKIKEYLDISEKDNIAITLKEGIHLDNSTQNDIIIKEKFKNVAGNIVNNYFKNFDVKAYKKRRELYEGNSKINILNNANVLLISDNEEDYNEMVKYGFKNINYFKSIIRADNYFKNHPDELNNYNIVLRGDQGIESDDMIGIELERKLIQMHNYRQIVYHKFYSHWYNPDKDNETVTYFPYNFWRRAHSCIEFNSRTELFDRLITEVSLSNRVVPMKQKEFKKIEDYINPKKLPVPKKKEELKILFLPYSKPSNYHEFLKEKLGLNIDFIGDNNFALREVQQKLGEYDIIVAMDMFSHRLLWMNKECAEQHKDTGRRLTLLATYDDDYSCIGTNIYDEDHNWKKIGNNVKIDYVFAGELSKELKSSNQEFKVLTKKTDETDDSLDDYHLGKKNAEEAIIMQAVNTYNEALAKVNNSSIEDLDFKTTNEYDEEYKEAKESEEARIKAVLEPINLYKEARSNIMNYLDYKEQGLINDNVEGLNIINDYDKVTVQNLYEGKILCSVTFMKHLYPEEVNGSIRLFQVQTINNKGNLEEFKNVGLYTIKYESIENIPNRPNDKQMNAILATCKKINNVISPINIEATKRKRKYASVFSKKRRNRL